MNSKRAGCLPGTVFFTMLGLALFIALTLTACGGETIEPTLPPEEISAAPNPTGWSGPPYAAHCNMETLSIDAVDAEEEASINSVLMAMDVPLYITAALSEPTTHTVYDADEASEREDVFRWTFLSRYLNHFAPEDEVEFGSQVTASREAVENAWKSWLCRIDSEALPPIPAPLAGVVSVSGETYSIEPAEGVYPDVSLVFAYLETDTEGREILTVYADITHVGDEEPYTVEIGLLRRPDGAYVLQRAGSANPEEDVYTLYEVTTYHAAVYLPADCTPLERNEKSASFASSTGLTVDIFEEAFQGTLAERRLKDEQEIPEPLFDFEADNRLEYGLIWDDGTSLRYHLVRQMEPGNLVCVQISVPLDWALDYFSLAESVFASFGASDFPVDIVLGLETHILTD